MRDRGDAKEGGDTLSVLMAAITQSTWGVGSSSINHLVYALMAVYCTTKEGHHCWLQLIAFFERYCQVSIVIGHG